LIEIEVVFADVERCYKQMILFETAPQVCQALAQATDLPLDLPFTDTTLAVSIWGRAVEQTATLVNGDRLEITRALVADPKHSRARKVNRTPRRGWIQRMV
jgi:putative ubiquitin-RnfH superfamily antitoxin RatB of RatAB toxin-antitoxin module